MPNGFAPSPLLYLLLLNVGLAILNSNKNYAFDDVIVLYRKCLVNLDIALLNANYGISKIHKVKKQKVNTIVIICRIFAKNDSY